MELNFIVRPVDGKPDKTDVICLECNIVKRVDNQEANAFLNDKFLKYRTCVNCGAFRVKKDPEVNNGLSNKNSEEASLKDNSIEISTDESNKIVNEIRDKVINFKSNGLVVKEYEQVIYDIDYLLLEANSGASYEQYFRWASVEEISRIVSSLNIAGLEDVAKITAEAINAAFPLGIPVDDAEKCEKTQWKKKQEKIMEMLFFKLEESNGRITNRLAEYAKKNDKDA